jgi:transmembrane sensor
MQEERFTLLAGLYLSGEASPAEREELEELLRRCPEWEPKLEALRRIWRSRQKSLVNKEDAYHRHLQRLNAQLEPQKNLQISDTSQNLSASPTAETSPISNTSPTSDTSPTSNTSNTPPRLRKLWLTTAAAASLTGAILLIHHITPADKTTLPSVARTVITNPGSRSSLTLPDGTTVRLNADSRLTYNENFTEVTREVQLSGEAYFDVAKDPHRPFLIHTNTIDIKVLGTAFNVRSYDNEKTTETDLVQGAVEVTLRNTPDKKIILKPNEKLTVHNDQVNITTGNPMAAANTDAPLMTVGKVHFQKKDSSITEILWTKDLLAFDNTSLEDVALQLQRWYGVIVTIPDEKLKSIRLNAVFGKENLQQAMEALSIAGNFTYTIRKNEVIISP